MSLSMADNWAQRQLVSMKAPVLFWQKQQRKSSLEKAALCREGNGAELLPCSLAAIDQRFSCCATPTTAHILPLPCPEINTKVRKWSQHGNLLFTIYFSSTILILFFRVTLFRYYSPGTHSVHSTLFWYQYELLHSVISLPQRLSLLQPIPSAEMYCGMKLWGIKRLINCWDKSINNAEIRDTATVSQTPLQETPRDRVKRKCPVWHHQRLPSLTCPIQQEEAAGAHLSLSTGFLFSPNTKNKNQIIREPISPLCAPCWKRLKKTQNPSNQFSPFQFYSLTPFVFLSSLLKQP